MLAERGSARATGILAPLLLVLAFAIALAYLAFDATRSRREAARRTVSDFANFAAFILGNAAQTEIERRLLYAFGPVRTWSQASGAPVPDPALIGRDPVEAERCALSGVPAPSYARLDLGSGELAVAGTPLPDPAARWLADTLRVEAAVFGRDWSFAHVFADRHGLSVIAYTVQRDTSGAGIAVYAKTSCLEIDGRSVFAIAASRTTALPPSLTNGEPTDSLLTMFARDPHDHVVYESPLAWASSVFGSTGPLPQLGNVELIVDLRPDVADRLVVGGVPYGGVPMALLLLLLIVVSGALAILQVRRQHDLIRAREHFISNVSHELRTPLQQILVFAELLRMESLRSEDERRHSVTVIERETRRLIQLVENVLAFARGKRDGVRPSRERVLLEPLVRDTVSSFQPLAEQNDAAVRIVADQRVVARGEADAIRRALLNLLDNAAKYGPRRHTITVTIGEVGASAIIAVEDEGQGIPPGDRERIWTPFSRLEREEIAGIAGSGIGLSIVRDLVERMHGSVRVDVAEGGGARFVLSLPAAGRE